MDTISFKRHRFPPEIIRRAVWLYARFTLSYRDVEDLLAERGLDISYESVRRWFLKFGAPIARNLRHTRPIPNGYWHLDEMVIVIRGQRYWLWRAVDNEGEVLDFLVQSKRNAQAALKLMRKLLKGTVYHSASIEKGSARELGDMLSSDGADVSPGFTPRPWLSAAVRRGIFAISERVSGDRRPEKQ